jgi:hypothetical protein
MAFETTTQLAQLVEKELGHTTTTASSQRDDIVDHLDYANKVVHGGGGVLNFDEKGNRKRDEVVFTWAMSENPKVVNLVAPVETGFTVAATKGSTTITFDSDPYGGVTVADWFIRIGSTQEVYRIASHTAAATNATLDAAYVGDTETAADFKLFDIKFDVGSSDILLPVGPFKIYSASRSRSHIPIVDKEEMLGNYPLYDIYKAFPREAALIYETGGTLTFQLSHYPEDVERLELDYVGIPSTLETSTPTNPVLPAQYRRVLAHLATHYIMIRNDDDRANKHLQMARDIFDELVDHNSNLLSKGDTAFGRVIPESGQDEYPKVIKVERPYDLG